MILKLVLLGTLQITAYRAVPEQTKASCVDRFHCTTSIGENVSELGVAVSQDLLKAGTIHYGDVVLIDGFGYRIVNDCLNARIRNSFDLFVYTRAEEKRIGVRHLKVYVFREIQRLPGEE